MKSLLPLAAVFAVTPLVVLACAQGSTADDVATTSGVTTSTAPTDPAKQDDPGKPITNDDSNDESTGSESADAGKKTTADAGQDAGGKDSGAASKPDASSSSGGAGKATGTPCSSTSECQTTLTCAYGTCRPKCTTEGTACAGAGLGVCEKLYENGTAVPNTLVCAVTCDLQKPTAACGSNTCIFDSTSNTTDCDKPGSLTAFAQCSTYNACKPGLACVNNQLYGNECEPWCRVGVAGDCPILSNCIDVYKDKAPMQGSTKLGLCQ